MSGMVSTKILSRKGEKPYVPPPTVPARVENFIPHGVISGYSRFTIIIPFVDGSNADIHSKQPQLVIGSTIIEYALILSMAP